MDFRLITATNKNIEEMVEKEAFRLDLFIGSISFRFKFHH
nr:sigma 54-interacting transcriptional regulator [Planococcus glaciei]